MSTALVLVEDGRRGEGRWEYGALRESTDLLDSMHARLRQAGTVLDYAPELADDVVTGGLALDAAYRQAVGDGRSSITWSVRQRKSCRTVLWSDLR